MAIDANKYTQKDELIAKFYTLRAGLSVIAEETDKIKAAENDLAELEEKNIKHNEQILTKYKFEIGEYAPSEYENELSLDSLKQIALERSNKRIDMFRAQLKEVENHKVGLSKAVLPGIATAFIGIFVAAIIMTISKELYNIGCALAMLSAYVFSFIVGIAYRKNVTEKEKATITLSPDLISRAYEKGASSVFNVLKSCEKSVKSKFR